MTGNPHLKIFGALAQLGERLSGRQKVKGSIPLGSTKISRRPIIGLIVRPFKSENASSNLVGVTKLF